MKVCIWTEVEYKIKAVPYISNICSSKKYVSKLAFNPPPSPPTTTTPLQKKSESVPSNYFYCFQIYMFHH